MTPIRLALVVTVTLAAAAPAAAQSAPRDPSQASQGPASALEFSAGYAGFVDDAILDHGVIGVGGRVYVSPRVSIGPEVVYMQGRPGHHDLFVTGNVTFDLLGGDGPPPRVVPFLVVGGGVMRSTDRLARGPYTSSEGAVTGGGGVRVRVTDRVFVGGDVRLGWELHYRVAGIVGLGG